METPAGGNSREKDQRSALRVVFMGTPEFAVGALESVHGAFTVVAVYTQPDKPVGRGLEMRATPVKACAQRLGLTVYQPEKLTQPGTFEQLTELRPDVIVVVAYGQILKTNVLRLPRLGCVNIHSSLLPRWRGAAPIQWAILEGDAETGVTTMHLVEKLDAGDILLQERTPISATDTAQTVHDRLASLGAELILPTLRGLDDGTLIGKKQDEAGINYASKLTKEMEPIDPSLGAAVLDRRIRALNPWPGTSVMVRPSLDGSGNGGGAETEAAPWTRLKIKRAVPHAGLSVPEGRIIERNGMVCLGTRAGSLELQVLQWEGKKEVDAAGFLNGWRSQASKAMTLEVGSQSK